MEKAAVLLFGCTGPYAECSSRAFCMLLPLNQPLYLLALTHAMCLIFVTRVWYTSSVLCGSWFNPLLTLPTYPQAHTHILSLCFTQYYFNKAPKPSFGHRLCSLCAKTWISILYHSYEILLDPLCLQFLHLVVVCFQHSFHACCHPHLCRTVGFALSNYFSHT